MEQQEEICISGGILSKEVEQSSIFELQFHLILFVFSVHQEAVPENFILMPSLSR